LNCWSSRCSPYIPIVLGYRTALTLTTWNNFTLISLPFIRNCKTRNARYCLQTGTDHAPVRVTPTSPGPSSTIASARIQVMTPWTLINWEDPMNPSLVTCRGHTDEKSHCEAFGDVYQFPGCHSILLCCKR